MAKGITADPNVYSAGMDFDYGVWTPGTRVDLVNVNWDNNYAHTWYGGRTNLNNYIDNKATSGITINQMTYAKPGEDVYLPISYNRANRYNYLRASNPVMPNPINDVQKDFYYFILSVEYVNPGVTRFRLQLDVWQTYIYDATFGNCYVERGHIGIANQNQFANYGRNYLTIPEGFDVGSDMLVVHRWDDEVFQHGEYSEPMVMVVSTVDIDAYPGTPEAPELVSAKGGIYAGMPSGASVYVFQNAVYLSGWLQLMQDKPWVTQGIISATLIPPVNRYGISTSFEPFIPLELTDQKPNAHTVTHAGNWREWAKQFIPEKYRHLLKFFTSDYMIIELTTLTGNAIAIKPELWNNPDIEIQDIIAITPPNQKLSAFPVNYNAYSSNDNDPDEDVAFATHLANFPTMSIVNNAAIGYLASNRNSILYGQSSASWAQQRALGSNQTQYDQASGALHTAMDMAGIGMNADIANTANLNRTTAAQAAVNATSQAVAGIGNALTPGGFGGAAIAGIAQGTATGINAGIQTAANDEGLAIRQTQAAQSVITQNKQGELVRDTNKSLSDWAAKGDYANAIAGVNARVQDAKMIQPTISGQQGGDILNYVNNRAKIRATLKMVDGNAFRVVGDYWLRYGYAIRAFIKPPANLMAMTKFTYWKMLETHISSANIPEGHKQALRGILEKGVTVYANPEDIGNIDFADNQPLGGISY